MSTDMPTAMAGRGRRTLLLVRYVVLVLSTGLAIMALARLMPTGIATLDAIAFAVSFVVGLRVRAAVARARGMNGKDLSWSAALLSGLAVVTLLGALQHQVRPEFFSVFAFQVLVGYLVGKATCAISLCCGAAPTLALPIALPVLEVIGTALVLAAAAAMMHVGASAALLTLTAGHLAIRGASRYLRTARWSALWAPDTVALAGATVVIAAAW